MHLCIFVELFKVMSKPLLSLLYKKDRFPSYKESRPLSHKKSLIEVNIDISKVKSGHV